MKGRWIPRPISPEEADVVRAALERAPVDRARTSLLDAITNLVVVDRCDCGCASVDFESDIETSQKTLIADALGTTPDGKDVGIIVWGDDGHIAGLEIYEHEPESSKRLPTIESIKPYG